MSTVNQIHPTGVGPSTSGASGRGAAAHAQERAAFDSVLADARVTLSRHARARLERRALPVGADQAARLASAIDRAAAKGSRTSLVMLNELALLVRIPERVVMTAMSPDAMRDGVVTQIDSAVMI